jgi:hypothetical protein
MFAGITILAWCGLYDEWVCAARAATIRLLIYISCAGALGATVYCIRGLYKHHSLGDFSHKHV